MSQRQLTKSVTNRRVSGVIAGIAEYFGLGRDVVTILRILFVVLAFGSWGGLIPLYFVASWIIPSAGSNAGRQNYRRTNEENWSSYADRWQSKSSSHSSGRKMKEAEPVEDEKKDDWSDF